MHHAALPAGVRKVLRSAFHEPAAGIRNEKLHAVEATIDQVAQECRPAGLVLLGALADAEDLPKTFRIDGAGHQQ
jgi:hypothetical protein